ncbi:MAG TPA: TRAP transporter substrate-binding protein [Gammaproteobacteria bacterium]|nr:TRAP transporter substrate-binding protein [Gammaproteobacteria bacterium]
MNKIFVKMAAAAVVALSFGATASAAQFNFTFAHVLMEDTPNAKAAVKFAQEVEEKSGGRIKINVRPAAQLGGDVEIIEQVQMNLVQIGIPPTATLGNFEPRLQILDLPFILPTYDTMVQVLDGAAGRQILDTLDNHSMYGVNFWGAGFRNITNNTRPIKSTADLKGIRMRVMQAPILITQYKAWGAQPTAMAFTEVYNGLQQGVVHGQENPLANIATMRFYEVQKYMTLTNHAYHGYAAVVNKDAWNSLPKDLQQVMIEAFNNGRDYARQLTLEDEKNILERIKGQIEIYQLTDAERLAFVRDSLAIHKEFEKVVTPQLLKTVHAAAGIKP